MLRVHLHLFDGEKIIRDPEGGDYADLAAARSAAVRALRDVIAADVLDGKLDLSLRIKLCDPAGTSLMTVAANDAVTLRGCDV